MKIIWLVLFELSEMDHFLKITKKAMDEYSELSILADSKADQGISEIESNLYGALMNRERAGALTAIHSLKELYQRYGKMPTKARSGYFNMLRFLNELEEFVIIASAEE